MSVSDTLHTITDDVSAWIASGKAPGRAELEILRRNLAAARTDARKAEALDVVRGVAVTELLTGVERGIADLAGLARRTARQMEQAA